MSVRLAVSAIVASNGWLDQARLTSAGTARDWESQVTHVGDLQFWGVPRGHTSTEMTRHFLINERSQLGLKDCHRCARRR